MKKIPDPQESVYAASCVFRTIANAGNNCFIFTAFLWIETKIICG